MALESIADGTSRVMLDLPPGGSVFVAFHGQRDDAERLRYEEKSSLAVNGPWKVIFDPTRGGPASGEVSWTKHADDGVKHYSGNGIYQKSVMVPKDWKGDGARPHLDLGDAREVAECLSMVAPQASCGSRRIVWMSQPWEALPSGLLGPVRMVRSVR